MIVFVALLAATTLPAVLPARAQTPGSSTARPPITDDTAQAIKQLKLQALDAETAKDFPRALRLYQQILRLDPDDALARQSSRDIEAALDRKTADDRAAALTSRDEAAKERRVRDLLTQAGQAVVEARTSGSGEPLARAQQLVAEAKKYAPSGDPELARIDRLIAQELDARRVRMWELWGVIGFVVLAAIVGAVLYVRRSDRVLEMTDGPQPGHVFALDKPSTALGALAAEVDWAIADPLRKISRHHCDVIRDGRRYFLVDRSMNGTFLNGQPLRKGEPVLLKSGDRIGLGGEVTLVFR